jgi:hypothetical protein
MYKPAIENEIMNFLHLGWINIGTSPNNMQTFEQEKFIRGNGAGKRDTDNNF